MNFPQELIDRLNVINPGRVNDIIEGFKNKKEFGIRLNPLKMDKKSLLEIIKDDSVESIPFIENAFSTKNKELYTKTPLMFTGAYFVQDVGSMAIVEALDVEPDMKVLDVCASPGSKSTHLLSKLDFPGFLVANEVTHNRVGRLVSNIGVWGQGCVLVSSQKTAVYQHLHGFFDRILIDAPCSGEGMFGKNPESIDQWSTGLIRKCASIQKEILSNVLKSLKVGGEFVYSTCTMAPEENEDIIQWLLEQYGDSLELLDITLRGVEFEVGLKSFKDKEYDPVISQYTKRIYPYMKHFKHQSFFIAKIRVVKALDSPQQLNLKEYKPFKKQMRYQDISSLPQKALQEFLEKMDLSPKVASKDVISLGFFSYYKAGWDTGVLKKLVGILHPVYVGVRVGTIKKDRIEPRLELALSTIPSVDKKAKLDLSLEDAQAFMNGQSLLLNFENLKQKESFVIVSYLSFPLGFGKISGNELKSYFNEQIGKKIINKERDR